MVAAALGVHGATATHDGVFLKAYMNRPKYEIQNDLFESYFLIEVLSVVFLGSILRFFFIFH